MRKLRQSWSDSHAEFPHGDALILQLNRNFIHSSSVVTSETTIGGPQKHRKSPKTMLKTSSVYTARVCAMNVEFQKAKKSQEEKFYKHVEIFFFLNSE